MPLSGVVEHVNEELEDNPELVNGDPYGKGWLVKVKLNSMDTSPLMDHSAYQKMVEG